MTYYVGYLQIDEMHSAIVLVDSMCKSVEVVHKLHTVVHMLPEVDCLDMLPKTEQSLCPEELKLIFLRK